MLRRVMSWLTGAATEAAAFDPAFYASIYPDLAGADPLAHWRNHGRRQGRIGAVPPTHRPFDPDFYLGRYPDVAASGQNPFEHWVRRGKAEGRIGWPPSDLPAFDTDYYLSRYPDVGTSGIEPRRHWLRFGLPEGRIAAWPAATQGPGPRLRDLLRASGLFDRDEYLANYRECIPEGCDPLDHYICIGQHRGYKPKAGFDPLVYRLHHPAARETGSMLHYLERRSRGETAGDDLTTTSAIPEVRHPGGWPNVHVQPQDLIDRDLRDNLAASERFGQEQVLTFHLDGRSYRLVAPSADDFFGRLSDDRPMAFSRLPHGFWDCLSELRKARGRVVDAIGRKVPAASFSDDEIDRLAERACRAVMPEMGVYEENFLRELLGEIERDEGSPDHFRSVSFKWQPTVDDRVFGRTEVLGDMEFEQLRFFARHFRPDRPVYEAMVWKRWVYSGDIMRIIPEAQARPVVLVGATRVKDLGRRWRLPWFSQLEIPLLSYDQRYAILDRCKAAVREAQASAQAHGTKKPLIMLQGGSFAAWLIARLFAWDPNAVYLDFGQTLHLFFLENPDVASAAWLRFHPRLIMENCRLDPFYDDLGIVLPPPFGTPVHGASRVP